MYIYIMIIRIDMIRMNDYNNNNINDGSNGNYEKDNIFATTIRYVLKKCEQIYKMELMESSLAIIWIL